MLYPGSIHYHQGLDIAIRAFGSVCNAMSDAEFHIYGDGPERRSLEELGLELGLETKVMLHDFIPMREMALVMSRASLGIVPKRGDSFGDEAFSTKSLEFMAMGVPLVMAATTIDRFYFDRSVVEFFEPGSADDLADKLLGLYKNPARRDALRVNGKRLIAKYDWNERKWEYLNLMQKLLGFM